MVESLLADAPTPERALPLYEVESVPESPAVTEGFTKYLPQDVAIRALEAEVRFHSGEIAEGPYRKPPMPEQQIALHEQRLKAGRSALAIHGVDAQVPLAA
jgi:hypothetical protein